MSDRKKFYRNVFEDGRYWYNYTSVDVQDKGESFACTSRMQRVFVFTLIVNEISTCCYDPATVVVREGRDGGPHFSISDVGAKFVLDERLLIPTHPIQLQHLFHTYIGSLEFDRERSKW